MEYQKDKYIDIWKDISDNLINNFNKMKNIKTITAIIVVIIISIFIWNTIIKNKEATFQKKLKEQQKEISELKNEQSDVEILSEQASIFSKDAKLQLENIDKLKESIKTAESKYEFNILTKRCYETQMDRLINGLEYNLEYCKVKDNLEQFRKKKY